MRMTTVSSGRITTQALISGEPSWREDRLRAAERNVEAERKPAAGGGGADDEGAAIDFGHVVHGCLPHALAAAWIAARTCWKVPQRQMLVIVAVDVGVGRLRLLLEQRRHRHDHAGLAIAALRHVVVDPGLLHLVQHAVLGETLDGGDLLAGRGARPAASRSAPPRRRYAPCRRRTGRCRSRIWCRSGRRSRGSPTAAGCRDRHRRRGLSIDGETDHSLSSFVPPTFPHL